jgi:hypothetical protein
MLEDAEADIAEEVPELQAAWAANPITDDRSDELLHHIPGLDLDRAIPARLDDRELRKRGRAGVRDQKS